MSLKKQTLSSLIWAFLDSFILKGGFFVATLFLARILGPSDFGLIGMISVFIAIGNSLVDCGLSASIIRTENANDSDFSTVFYLNLGLSLIIYLIFYFSAPLIAHFYNQKILLDVIRLYCLSFIISAFSSIQLALLNKEMEFNKILKYNLPGTIIGIAIGTSLGYFGYGVWSIVWLYLSTQILQTITLWLFSKWKPSLIFSIEKFKFHFGFGYKLMLSGLLDTIFNNIYNVLIGKYFSLQSLGFFERAKSTNEYPVMALTGVISKVTYSLLSKIQDNKVRINNVYKQLLQFTFFLTTPIMFALAAIATPLFEILLGKQWLPAVPYFQIMCLASIFYPIHAFNINILKIYGRTDLYLKLEIAKKIIISICILATFQFGVIGLVWSNVITSFLALLINTYYSSEMINYKTKTQLLDMLPVFLISSVVFIIMNYLVTILGEYSLFLQIIIPSIFGIFIYLLINYIIKSKQLLFSIQLIKERNL